MKQFNLNLDAAFEKVLARYMQLKGLTKKSEALRLAVAEALAALEQQKPKSEFRSLIGFGLKVPLTNVENPLSEDDLWS